MKYEFNETVGHETISGTDWPIDVVVYKAIGKWVVAKLFNGCSRWSTETRTKREALAIAQDLVDEAKRA